MGLSNFNRHTNNTFMKYLILLLLIISSIDSYAKRKEKDLDKLMKIQLAENAKYWNGMMGTQDYLHDIDSVKQVFDSLGYYMTKNHVPRCITKFSDIKFRRISWIEHEQLADTLEDSVHQICRGQIIDWVWLGDIKPIYVDMFKCNDPIIEKHVQEELVEKYNKMTILYKSYSVPMARIDTINGETIVGTEMFDGFSEHHIYLAAQKTKEHLKGVTVINGATVFLFGNAIESYFYATDRDIAMPSPLPPHKTNNIKDHDKGTYRNEYKKIKYTTYANGKLRNSRVTFDRPFWIMRKLKWTLYDTFITDDIFLGVIEEAQKSKGLNITSAEDLFDRNLFNTTITRY